MPMNGGNGGAARLAVIMAASLIPILLNSGCVNTPTNPAELTLSVEVRHPELRIPLQLEEASMEPNATFGSLTLELPDFNRSLHNSLPLENGTVVVDRQNWDARILEVSGVKTDIDIILVLRFTPAINYAGVNIIGPENVVPAGRTAVTAAGGCGGGGYGMRFTVPAQYSGCCSLIYNYEQQPYGLNMFLVDKNYPIEILTSVQEAQGE